MADLLATSVIDGPKYDRMTCGCAGQPVTIASAVTILFIEYTVLIMLRHNYSKLSIPLK